MSQNIWWRWPQLNTAVPLELKIEFRIGAIIIDDNDIFGDGVNIAAMRSRCPAGTAKIRLPMKACEFTSPTSPKPYLPIVETIEERVLAMEQSALAQLSQPR